MPTYFPTGRSFQIFLRSNSMTILDELKDTMACDDYSTTFATALQILDGIITEVNKGSTFFVKDKDGKVSEYQMFI